MTFHDRPSNRRRLRLSAGLAVGGAALLMTACGADDGSSSSPVDGAGAPSGQVPGSDVPGMSPTGPTSQGPVDGPVAVDTANPAPPPGDPLSPGDPPAPGDVVDGMPSPTPDGPVATDPEPVVVDPPPFEPAPALLRRLTRTQFQNAVRDLLGAEVSVSDLDADNWSGDFAAVGASVVSTSQRGVEQYHAAIESAVDEVFADDTRREQFVGCSPSAADDACVQSFIETMGRRAWRRPLEPTETQQLAELTQSNAAELGSAIEGVRWTAIALFTSPNFLYRPELGVAATNGEYRFSGFETASRLAFLIWNSVPDDALLDSAASGVLDTPDGVRTTAESMLDAPKGRASIGAFAEEYMRVDRVQTQPKDQALFPEYGVALQQAMARDMRDTWEAIAFDDRASALELFETPRVFVNAELAELYGLDSSGLDSGTFSEAFLPADSPRVGILGKAAFLSQFANQHEGSPTLRGKFMRQSLMCRPVPPPPGNVDVTLPEPPSDMPMTKRQRLEAHSVEPACAVCHALMDPMGLPFETFDAIGRYRTTDHGLPIDASGDFDSQPVADARELGIAMAQSDSVANCLVRKYYSYAHGFAERAADGTVLNELGSSFRESGYQFRELVLGVVTHPAFAQVSPQADEDGTQQ